MPAPFTLAAAGPILFGDSRLDELALSLGQYAGAPQGGRILIVADRALETLGVVARVGRLLNEACRPAVIAPAIEGEPHTDTIDALARLAESEGAGAIVALGGGAAIDAAKLAAVVAHGERRVIDFALGQREIPSRGLPVVAVPTTAGTGAEVTRTAVASAPDGEKLWFWGDGLLPVLSILDGDLTRTLPETLTAWTGMDACTHALEAATSMRTTAPARAFGLAALDLIARYLPRAVADGQDGEARGQVLWAATLAGRAIEQCGTHLGHNIGHALGSLARVHHGHATALGLEAALPWLVADMPEAAREDFANAAAALGEPREAEALPAAFSALMRASGIPARLPEAAAHLDEVTIADTMRRPANAPMLAASPRPADDEAVATLAARVAALRPTTPGTAPIVCQ
ncbi:MAG: iron-containing alcohol dehydrogenase [Pseudomonadota bacterium]